MFEDLTRYNFQENKNQFHTNLQSNTVYQKTQIMAYWYLSHVYFYFPASQRGYGPTQRHARLNSMFLHQYIFNQRLSSLVCFLFFFLGGGGVFLCVCVCVCVCVSVSVSVCLVFLLLFFCYFLAFYRRKQFMQTFSLKNSLLKSLNQ